MNLLRVVATLSILMPAIASSAEERIFRSGPAQITLVELFTSEGCSSGPPAEEWLNMLKDAPGLWRDFVPVAFHVNYWDRLGWKDALATPGFTERQHAYAAAWRASSVYTPGFVRNGAEWRPRGAAPEAGKSTDGGALTLRWRSSDRTALVESSSAAGDLEVHVALLGGGIVNAVKRGENSGRTLRHEFVALRLESAALREGRATLALPPRTDLKVSRHAVAAWITRRGSLTATQAVGGWID
ncbi:MAG: DUF1223 domain-containing protein [Opitutaceae bacterium]|nr:DUF1223 domain-containing protein [Opitutaceae bacterium]